jgi:hypothetical protein
MTKAVYIETSVVSYYTGRGSRDVIVVGRQESTKAFWTLLGSELTPFVSGSVIMEAGCGDPQLARLRLDAIAGFAILPTTEAAEELARAIVGDGGVPAEYPEDALHVAIAALGGMDCIVTWNFAHLNNPFTLMRIRQSVENHGYNCPEIVAPDAFLGENP